ncbi:MAG TPA: hypothetical protein DDX98_04915 [Bacteroidales bacterium]|jgi:two-component system LytT family sensor kinase|nr:hypothetical protein [Bacteroidales bacterium]
MHYTPLINKLWPRIFVALAAGVLFRLPFDIIIGLSYSYYVLENYVIYYSVSVASALLCFEIFNQINNRLDRRHSWSKSPNRRFWLQFIYHSIVGIILVLSLRYMVDIFISKQFFYVLRIEILSVLVIVFTILSYEILEYGSYLAYHSKYSLAEMERFKKENAEFRFETLMNQVNPHFLFNSLNTLSSLVYEDADTASKYIRELARVYRYVLENKQNELVPLNTDLDFVGAYIYLLELRFKDMISFDFKLNDEHSDKLIAPMTIQLLIENAVKHNIVSRKKHLKIKVFSEDDYLVVSNNIQLRPVKEYSSGIGLTNIKSRYAYLNNNQVIVQETDTDFIVKIPLIANNESN